MIIIFCTATLINLHHMCTEGEIPYVAPFFTYMTTYTVIKVGIKTVILKMKNIYHYK